jgi:hypothetical protein
MTARAAGSCRPRRARDRPSCRRRPRSGEHASDPAAAKRDLLCGGQAAGAAEGHGDGQERSGGHGEGLTPAPGGRPSPCAGDGDRAARRPPEAVSLHDAGLVLPDDGWGQIDLTGSEPRESSGWTDTGAARQTRGLVEHRAETRSIPTPPFLVEPLETSRRNEIGLPADSAALPGIQAGPRPPCTAGLPAAGVRGPERLRLCRPGSHAGRALRPRQLAIVRAVVPWLPCGRHAAWPVPPSRECLKH